MGELVICNKKSQVPIFCEVLGNNPTVRVIDFLITGRDFDYSITDISRGANVGRNQVYEIIKNLLDEGIIIKTRDVGTSQLFKLNQDSKKTSALINFYEKLLQEL